VLIFSSSITNLISFFRGFDKRYYFCIRKFTNALVSLTALPALFRPGFVTRKKKDKRKKGSFFNRGTT